MIMIKAFSMLRGPAVFALALGLTAALALAQTADSGVPVPGDPQSGPVLTNAPGAFVDTNSFLAGSPAEPPPLVYTWFTNLDGSTMVATNFGPAVPIQKPVRLETRAEITPDGAVLEGGSFRVLADGNLNHDQSILIAEPASDGSNPLAMHVTAIAASCPRTGKRLWIGTLQDCHGIVLEGQPVRVLWTNAFSGIKADVLLQYNINSIIQDVIVREPLPLPDDPDLPQAELRIEVWSEAFAGPEPAQRLQTISLAAPGDGKNDPALHPDKLASDAELDWGASRMIRGSAFRIPFDGAEASAARWPVAKQWVASDNRKFIVESVDYEAMKPLLESLRTARLHPGGAPRPPGTSTPLMASTPTGSASGAAVRPTAFGALPPVIPRASSSGRALSAASPSRAALPGPSVPPAFSPQPLAFSLPPAPAPLAQWDARQTAAWSQRPGANLDWTLVNGLLLSVDLGGTSAKVGPAAVGKGASDFWNLYSVWGATDATLSDLRYSDNSLSGASLRVQSGAPQYTYPVATGDVMYDTYTYCYNANIVLTFNGLQTGIYDIFLYGRGAADDQFGIFTINGVTKQCAAGPYWNNNRLAGGIFVENTDFLVFRAVAVSAGTPLVITTWVSPGQYTVINGLQIAAVVGNAPPMASAGSPQTITFPATASLSGSATDDNLPVGSVLSLSWSTVSGPGTVSFSPATGTGGALNSTATFSAPGIYVLRLTA